MSDESDETVIPPFLREVFGTDASVRAANHWVPFTYLKHFASDPMEPLLWLYDRESPSSPGRVHARVLGVENRLYVVDHVPVPDLVERFLGWIDGHWDGLWRKMICGPDTGGFYAGLSRDENESLSLYVAFQQMRTPFAREIIHQIAVMDATVELRRRLLDVEQTRQDLESISGERPSSAFVDDLRSALETGGIALSPNRALWLVPTLLNAMDIAQSIGPLSRRVVTAPDGIVFPTSDLPVVLVHRDEGHARYRLGAGWLEDQAEGTLTLDSRHVLVIRAETDDPFIGTREWCQTVVRRTVQHSRRFVFSPIQDSEIERMIRDSRPVEWVIESGGRRVPLHSTPAEILRLLDTTRSDLVRVGPRL